MAREDDNFRARREARRKEDEPTNSQIIIKDDNMKLTIDKLLELFDRGEKMLEQMNSTYSMYISGVETNRPDQRRKALDALMLSIQMMPKPMAVYRFRAQNILSTYNMYRDRWDRQMKDLETGKLKRIVRPGRSGGAAA